MPMPASDAEDGKKKLGALEAGGETGARQRVRKGDGGESSPSLTQPHLPHEHRPPSLLVAVPAARLFRHTGHGDPLDALQLHL